MKRLFAILLIAVMLAGCTTHTKYGDCVGLGDDQNKNLHYKLSGWNLAIGIIFFETVVVPIVVILDDAVCPIGPKQDEDK